VNAAEAKELKKLSELTNKMHIKLFGNGTQIGCIDHRLEVIEAGVKDFVTKEQCALTHKHVDDIAKNSMAIKRYMIGTMVAFLATGSAIIALFIGG
jgi:hypothetical protein